MIPTALSICAVVAGNSELAAEEVLTLPETRITAPGSVGEEASGLGSSVLSPDDLDLFQSDSLAELSLLAPNLFFSTSDTRGYGDIVTLRGQGNTLFFGPPAVGLYVDDVPYSDAFLYPGELLRIESVEVRPGPQGAGYGRNAPGGLIEITTLAATAERRFGGRVEAGSHEARAFSGFSAGPLGGGAGHVLQLYYRERDGFLRNTFLGSRPDDRSVAGALGMLVWRPRDDFEAKLRLAAERVRDGAQRISALSGNPNPFAVTDDPFTVSSNTPGENEIDRYQASLHLRKDFGWGRAKSITAWQDWELGPQITDLDLGSSPFPLTESVSTIFQDQSLFTHEFRFEGPAGKVPLEWRAGAFYMHKETDGDATRFFPVLDPITAEVTQRTLFEFDEDNLALFGRGSYEVTDDLVLEAGGRLDFHDVAMWRSRAQTVSGFPGAPPVELDPSSEAVYFSPTAGARYRISEELTTFARSGLGIKPHGFTAFSDDPDLAAFGEERNWSNEIGLRYWCPDHRLNVVLRAFWNLIDDYQLNVTVPDSTNFVVVNAEEVTSRGIEAELQWQPLPNLGMRGSLGWTDAEFDTYRNPFHDPADAATGPPGYDGRRVPFIPEFTVSGGVRYDLPRGFFVAANVTAGGETFYDPANDPGFREGGYVVWDAKAGYECDHWGVTLFGRNLFDEEYYTFINPGINAGAPGAPQVVGVQVDVEFW